MPDRIEYHFLFQNVGIKARMMKFLLLTHKTVIAKACLEGQG